MPATGGERQEARLMSLLQKLKYIQMHKSFITLSFPLSAFQILPLPTHCFPFLPSIKTPRSISFAQQRQLTSITMRSLTLLLPLSISLLALANPNAAPAPNPAPQVTSAPTLPTDISEDQVRINPPHLSTSPHPSPSHIPTTNILPLLTHSITTAIKNPLLPLLIRKLPGPGPILLLRHLRHRDRHTRIRDRRRGRRPHGLPAELRHGHEHAELVRRLAD